MPELPDVEFFKKYLDSTALRQEIRHSSIRDKRIVKGCSPQKVYSRLKGSEIVSTERRGKFLLCQLSEGDWLVMHFGMTGELKYYKDRGEAPEYACLRVDFTNGYHLAYTSRRMLGQIRCVDERETFVAEKQLGIDALSGELTFARFRELLKGRTGMIKPGLMNQSIIAGIGNIYSDEILFQAEVHPETKIDKLGADKIEAVYRAMRKVLKAAVKRNADITRLPKSYLLPRRGQDEPDCPRCGGKMLKKKVGGRASYLCPNCQKKS